MIEITVEEVVQAYKDTGRKPTQQDFFEDNSCCGLGALCLALGGPEINKFESVVAYLQHKRNLELQYLSDYIDGFDGNHGSLYNENSPGYIRGKECWEKVKDLK